MKPGKFAEGWVLGVIILFSTLGNSTYADFENHASERAVTGSAFRKVCNGATPPCDKFCPPGFTGPVDASQFDFTDLELPATQNAEFQCMGPATQKAPWVRVARCVSIAGLSRYIEAKFECR